MTFKVSKINCIIFSKNRAMQLDCLLRSIDKFAPDLFDRINILYKSHEEHPYDKLIKKYGSGSKVNWIKEDMFRENLLSLIDHDFEYTCFLVDDIIFFSEIDRNKIISSFGVNTLCFSLRLGLNCCFSHPANATYSLPNHLIHEGIIFWNWKNEVIDFGYPLSTDGHIFKTTQILSLLIKTEFTNPNTMEGNLQAHLPDIKEFCMQSFEFSKIVSLPVNLVQTAGVNRNGELFFFPTRELQDLYNSGNVIDFEEMDFSNVIGPHQELPLMFKKNG